MTFMRHPIEKDAYAVKLRIQGILMINIGSDLAEDDNACDES